MSGVFILCVCVCVCVCVCYSDNAVGRRAQRSCSCSRRFLEEDLKLLEGASVYPTHPGSPGQTINVSHTQRVVIFWHSNIYTYEARNGQDVSPKLIIWIQLWAIDIVHNSWNKTVTSGWRVDQTSGLVDLNARLLHIGYQSSVCVLWLFQVNAQQMDNKMLIFSFRNMI